MAILIFVFYFDSSRPKIVLEKPTDQIKQSPKNIQLPNSIQLPKNTEPTTEKSLTSLEEDSKQFTPITLCLSDQNELMTKFKNDKDKNLETILNKPLGVHKNLINLHFNNEQGQKMRIQLIFSPDEKNSKYELRLFTLSTDELPVRTTTPRSWLNLSYSDLIKRLSDKYEITYKEEQQLVKINANSVAEVTITNNQMSEMALYVNSHGQNRLLGCNLNDSNYNCKCMM